MDQLVYPIKHSAIISYLIDDWSPNVEIRNGYTMGFDENWRPQYIHLEYNKEEQNSTDFISWNTSFNYLLILFSENLNDFTIVTGLRTEDSKTKFSDEKILLFEEGILLSSIRRWFKDVTDYNFVGGSLASKDDSFLEVCSLLEDIPDFLFSIDYENQKIQLESFQ